MAEWHYIVNGTQYGPVSARDLKQLASEGKFGPGDYLWKEGIADWITADKVKGLFDAAPAMAAATPQSTVAAPAQAIPKAAAVRKAVAPVAATAPSQAVNPVYAPPQQYIPQAAYAPPPQAYAPPAAGYAPEQGYYSPHPAELRDMPIQGFSHGLPDVLMVAFFAAALLVPSVVSLFRTNHEIPLITIWLFSITRIFFLFAVDGPLLWLAVFIAGALLKYRMPRGMYRKAAGWAAVPGFFLAMILFNHIIGPGPTANLLTFMACFFALLGLVAASIGVFRMDAAATATAAALGAVFYVIGQFLWLILFGLIASFLIHQNGGQTAANAQVPGSNNNSFSTQVNTQVAVSPPGPSDLQPRVDTGAQFRFDMVLGDMRRTLENLQPMLREDATTHLAELRQQYNDLKAAAADPQRNAQAEQLLAQLDAKVRAYPSKDSDETLFKDLVGQESWKPLEDDKAKLGDEVAIKQLRVRIPSDATLELQSSPDDPEGVKWVIRGAEFGVSLLPIQNARQRQPWITEFDQQKQSAQNQKLYFVERRGWDVATGAQGGLNLVRLTPHSDDPSRVDRQFMFVGRAGDNWLMMHTNCGGDAAAFQSFLAMARSVRLANPGEAGVDPFDPKFVALALAKEQGFDNRADQLLIAKGPAAEDAVLALLPSNNDDLQKKIIDILGKIGTSKSIPVLQQYAIAGKADWPQKASDALARISPKEFDQVGLAVLAVQSDDGFHRGAAYKVLAKAKVDDRQDEVIAAIEKSFPKDGYNNDARDAIVTWANKDTVPHAMEWLGDQDRGVQTSALAVLGRLKDPRALPAIEARASTDEDGTARALIAFGPGGEDAALAMLKEHDQHAGNVALRALKDIGTARCLPVLEAIAANKHNPFPFMDGQAKDAIAAIHAREAAAHPSN